MPPAATLLILCPHTTESCLGQENLSLKLHSHGESTDGYQLKVCSQTHRNQLPQCCALIGQGVVTWPANIGSFIGDSGALIWLGMSQKISRTLRWGSMTIVLRLNIEIWPRIPETEKAGYYQEGFAPLIYGGLYIIYGVYLRILSCCSYLHKCENHLWVSINEYMEFLSFCGKSP